MVVCEEEIWFGETLGTDVGCEDAHKEDGREMKFDSTPLKKHLGGPHTKKAKHREAWFERFKKDGT